MARRLVDLSIHRGGNGLISRTLTGLALGAAVVAAVVGGGWPLTAMILAATLAMTAEWNSLSDNKVLGLGAVVHGVFALLALALALQGLFEEALWVVLGGALVSAFAAKLRGKPVFWAGFGAIYLSSIGLSVFWLMAGAGEGAGEGAGGGGGQGAIILLWTLAVVWMTDTGAYLVGLNLGRHKMTPTLSPNKTWEGGAGGTIFGVLTGWAVAAYAGLPIPLIIGLSLVISVTAQLGDLLESALKRRFSAKDSSNFVPGHGGILDMVDGLVTSLPMAVMIIIARGTFAA